MAIMGNYMIDIAKEIIAEYGDKFQKLTETEALKQLGDIGIGKVKDKIKKDLNNCAWNSMSGSVNKASTKTASTKK